MSDAKHDHPLELLSSYLDDELPVDERAPIDRHLAICPECRDQLDALRRLSRAVAEEVVPPPPDDLEARVLRRLDAASVVPMRRRRFVVPATIAATIAAASLVAVVTWKQGGFAPVPRPERAAETADATRLRDKVAANAPAASPEPAQPPPPAVQGLVVPAEAPSKTIAKEKKAAAGFDMDVAKLATTEQGIQGVGASKDERPDDAIGRAAGGAPIAAVVPEARNALKATALACVGAVDDAGVEASWEVTDLVVAVRDLEAMAASLGGRLERPGAAPGATFAVVLPVARYDAFDTAARGMGIAGLSVPSVGADGACIRQRIAVRQIAPR